MRNVNINMRFTIERPHTAMPIAVRAVAACATASGIGVETAVNDADDD